MKVLIHNKKISWRWVAIDYGKHEIYWLGYVRLNLKYRVNGMRQWFAYIKTPLFYMTKNNGVFSFGVCFGKYYVGLYFNF